MYTAGAQHSSSRLSLWRPAPQEKRLLCVNVACPGWASPEKRSRPGHGWKGRPRNWQRSTRWYQVHTFGGRPHKRNYCFVLTSLVLGGLHQRSEVALPTGGRADPAVGNEALAGTRRSVFFAGTRRSLVPHTKTKTIFSTLKPRLVEHTHELFLGDVSIRNLASLE